VENDPVIGTIVNIFRIQDLRNKILFTVALLAIYRVGFHIQIPGFNQDAIKALAQSRNTDNPLGRAAEYLQIFTGGTLSQSSLFGLGIMPYITASIILMLLGEVVPSLKKLRQEGQTGYKKIQEYTRYLTVLICIIQAIMYIQMMTRGEQQMIYAGMERWAIFLGVVAMTAGTIFLMWLGEQIDEYGIGNGISLIIMAGIIARMPWAMYQLFTQMNIRAGAEGGISLPKVLFLGIAFVAVVAGAILITQAQRRIPIQQAKQMRGRRMYGGARHYLPLRVNHGGVMPIIFASSFMMFPPIVVDYIHRVFPNSWLLGRIAGAMSPGAYTYNILYMALIFLFAYFWVTVQFQPREMAKNLRDSGSFIPGLRPGRRTAEYLETVMTRITYYGAAFLAAISIIPTVIAHALSIDWRVTTFLGGTGLLIVVSVSLDLVQKIEANLLMRSYEGFTSSGRIKGAYA